MRTVAIVLLCLFVLVGLPGVVKINNGYYFSLRSVVEHFGAFPSFPALDWGGDFLASGAALLGYGGSLYDWFTGFDPWVKGRPDYMGKVMVL